MEFDAQDFAKIRDAVQNRQYRCRGVKYKQISLVGGVLDGIRTVLSAMHNGTEPVDWVIGVTEQGPIVSTYRNDGGRILVKTALNF